MQNKIHLRLVSGLWTAETIGPKADETRRLFGTATLPTPFTAQSSGAKVLEAIKLLNPDSLVTIESEAN